MKKIAYVLHERGECKNMKNKKEKKQEEEELTGMAAVWDYLKTFLIIFCVVFAMNKLVIPVPQPKSKTRLSGV